MTNALPAANAGENAGVAEAEVISLQRRIERRRLASEFTEAPVAPVLDTLDAQAVILTRLESVLALVRDTRRVQGDLEKSLGRSKRRLRLPYVGGLVIVLAAIGLSVADLLVPGKGVVNLAGHVGFLHQSGRVATALVTGLAALVALLLAWRWLGHYSPRATQISELLKRDLALTDELETRLNFEVDRLLRLDANERGEREGTLALTPEAPDLIELETARAADTPDIGRLRELVTHASTSAFAVAGPRGIGKSTLIRALTGDRSTFDVAVVVPAPVRYDPDALLRRIYSDLALAILRRHGAEEVLVVLQESSERRSRARRSVLAVSAAAVGSALFALDLLQLRAFSIGTAGTLGILLAYGAYLVIFSQPRPRRISGRSGVESEIIDNAVEALESLRWSTEASRTAKTSIGAPKVFLGAEDTDSSTRKEREWSRPELVADLVAFLRRHLTLSRRANRAGSAGPRLAVAVDELDKLSDSAEILETINSLKDLFRIPGVHFLVSVSSDAMTRFALRGVVSRDAFDSSFDAVIELRRLSALESHEVLASRAIGFPRSLSAVSHAWSGGLPRDLIRVARRCVELRRNGGTTSIDELASLIMAEDLGQTLTALRAREYEARAGQEDESPCALTPLIDELSDLAEDSVLGTRRLQDTLMSHALAADHVDPLVRAATSKVLVGAVVTNAFAAAVSQQCAGALGTQDMWRLADELAAVNALQNEPLGEMLSAGTRAREHLLALGVHVPELAGARRHRRNDPGSLRLATRPGTVAVVTDALRALVTSGSHRRGARPSAWASSTLSGSRRF